VCVCERERERDLRVGRIGVSSKTSFKARVAKGRDGAVGVEDDEAGVEGGELGCFGSAGEG
jgi:hypothetical protein